MLTPRESLSERILKEEHRIYAEAIALVLSGLLSHRRTPRYRANGLSRNELASQGRAVSLLFLAIWFLGETWRGLLILFQRRRPHEYVRGLDVAAAEAGGGQSYAVYGSLPAAGSLLFYRIMYHFAGLNPLPFRIACYALMMLNIWLVYRLVRVVTGIH